MPPTTRITPSLSRFPLKILHLTDLHFGDPSGKGHYWNTESSELKLAPHNQRGLLGSLIRDLQQQKLQPDLVLVTGDVLDRAEPRGVPLAVDFFAELAEHLKLQRTRIVFVPGNHDVTRDSEPTKRYEAFGDIWSQFYGSLRPSVNPATPAHLRVEHFDYAAELGVEVIGFNSCEELDAATKQEHGSVKTGQRDCAERLLKASEGKGLFRIALMHHHLERAEGTIRDDFSVMDDAAALIKWLAKHRFQLVLHGHHHVDWQRNLSVEEWRMAIAAGASAGVARYGRAEWNLQLGYQVIVIDEATRGQRIRREYVTQRQEWAAAGRENVEQVLHFGPEPSSANAKSSSGSTAGGYNIQSEHAKRGSRSDDELRAIAKQLLDDATPPSLLPLFPNIPQTVASAIEELGCQPRRVRYDERRTSTIFELMTRERSRQMLIAPRGAGKSFALWHVARTMMADSSTIPLFLPLGRFRSWNDVLDHLKLFIPDPEEVLRDPRCVVFLDGWSEFAHGNGGDSEAHRKVISMIGDRRIIASARHGSEHDTRFEITHLEPFPGDVVRRVLKIAFPKAVPPAGALLEFLRLPLALMLHLLLGGPAATRGDLLEALQRHLLRGLPESLTRVMARAAARTALDSEKRWAAFEAELRDAGAELGVSDPIELVHQLGTFGATSIEIRPVHDLYWSWLVGRGLFETGLIASAMGRLDLRESVELAIESGVRLPQKLVDEIMPGDAVLATRLAATVSLGANIALNTQTRRMLTDSRAATRRRGILAGLQSADPSLFRLALDALTQLTNDGLYVFAIGDTLRMDILWQQRVELATRIGAKGTEQVLAAIAMRGDERWVDWLAHLVTTERLTGDIAAPIAIACSQTIPAWTRPYLDALGEELYRLHRAAKRGINVSLARWAAEEYQHLPRPTSNPWMQLNDILVQCGDDAVFEGLLQRFDKLSAKAQETLGYAILERGEPWISKFQRKAFASGAAGHHYRLSEYVSSLIDDETARRWIETGPQLLGWQVLIKRHGNAVVPELLARLPKTFSDLHVIPELRAMASLEDAPEEIVNELWSRMSGNIKESVLEDMLCALARVRLRGIPSVIGKLRNNPSFLPPLSFSRFLVLLAQWEGRMGVEIRFPDGMKDWRFSEWIRLVRWEKERNEPLVGHRHHRAALPISDDVLDAWAAGEKSLTKFVQLSKPLDRYHAKAVDYLLAQPSGAKEVLELFGDVLSKFPESALLRLFDRTKEEGPDGYRRLLRAVAASNEPANREFHAALIRYFLDQPSLDIHASSMLAGVLRVHSADVLRTLLQEAINTSNGLWLVRDVEEVTRTLLVNEEGQWL